MALVHDWLTVMRGGERCLEVFCEIFPDAPIYTLVHVKGSESPVIRRHPIVTSFIQKLWGADRGEHQRYLMLYHRAIRAFEFSGYDLVISLSHSVAKAIRRPPGALHVSYCFSPMRYVWDLYDDYFGPRAGLVMRTLGPPTRFWQRKRDKSTENVDAFVAISQFIADRIRRVYGRTSDVIHPPVDLARFRPAARAEDFYLVVAGLVPYKRVDLAIAAANRLGRRLLVVGTGTEAARLRAAAGPTVEFLGWRSDAEVADLYARCRAVLFPGVEDYGIVPLEAAASGRPTIAFARGGALETMVGLDRGAAPPTAVFFDAQTEDGMVDAILRFEAAEPRFQPAALRAHAAQFDRPIFKRRIAEYVEGRWAEFLARRAC